MPNTLNVAEQACEDVFKSEINSNQARNLARMVCTPLFQELSEETIEGKLLTEFAKPMTNMSFCVGVDKRGRMITSDKTMYVCAKEFPCKEYEEIIFPISSELCLFLIGGEEKSKLERKNFLIPIDDELHKTVICAIANAAFEKLYSNYLFDEQELQWINAISLREQKN